MTEVSMTEFRAELAKIIGVLPDRLPEVFAGTRPRALKVGIRYDIEHRFPKANSQRLADWLGRYTSSRSYLKQVAHGEYRHDLDGQDAEQIDEASRQRARARLHVLRLANPLSEPAREAAE